MPEQELTQTEADALLALEKVAVSSDQVNFPDQGGVLILQLASTDGRQQFLLDVRKARIDLVKGTYQNRARQTVILARLDIGGPPHRNPDGEEVPCPHLHLYREGFGDKWAIPLPSQFTDPGDLWQSLEDFMSFINVSQRPNIQRGLFT
ncbi:MAG: hypothetical protein KF743_12245 [Fimbriimonadaceae bacterium]|nr:hypothetical protein [Fimbriimonadaceae bacterium]